MLNIIHNDNQGQALFLTILALVPVAAVLVIVYRVLAAIL